MFTVLFGRFVYIQATGQIQGVDLEQWAKKKRTSSYTLSAERGNIMDRNGMTLAYDRPTYTVQAIIDETYSKDVPSNRDPLHVDDIDKTAQALAPILGMEESEIHARLEKEGPFQVEFGSKGTNLSQDQKDKIEELELPGIIFSEEPTRFYPNGTFASHILGFTQADETGELTGAMGIEEQKEELLKGEDGAISYERDKYNDKLLDPNEVIKEPDDGSNVYLTIDQKVQTFLEDAMSKVNEQYQPKSMTAVVMDPKTGEILALSNRPSFNPNLRSNIQNWYNDVIARPFEPGSTMKIFTFASAIDAGVYNGEASFQSGSYQPDGSSDDIHDHNNGEGWGAIPYDEGFARSSNVAAGKVAYEMLGPELYREYLEKFNLTKETGIDLPGEASGRLVYDTPLDVITTSFGQATTVTPIQQLMAASAVANDGKMMKPYVISEVIDPDTGDTLEEKKSEVAGEPISSDAAKQTRQLMEKVVHSEEGTGKVYALNDYTVAGKTGTAQIVDPETRRYMTGKGNHIFSFLGMAPADDPELMMYVSVEQPELEPTEVGNEPSSHIFKTVMENSLHYLDIQPDKSNVVKKMKQVDLTDVTEMSVTKAKKELSQAGLEPFVLGSGGEVTEMLPMPNQSLLEGERVFLKTNGTIRMPDLTGWSLREVLNFGKLSGLKVNYIGNGFVYDQGIQPDAKITEDTYLTVDLKPPNEQAPKDEDGQTEEDEEETIENEE
ncbi:penicillin-binding protein 2B [Pontibacillus halophilus JSM 076056 = DSM 19796]|uniref:serine-type D-Ala-D-Ala carboxypeptidase n=1 Tax=Pontibacillus halophilus JSM 076056 = DSM 19796 TaxID=1385510 RepID=A0A0A5IBP8_9BACI|nr:penicillin-binding protein 2B [Pontibacillus halophilus JSM 076056 = DSM 19796]